MSAISAEFSHFRLVKTRKVVILEMEIPEEAFENAISVLGMPIGGKSHPVGIALLDATKVSNSTGLKPKRNFDELPLPQQAVLLCKDIKFWEYMEACGSHCVNEDQARLFICQECKISSRSEITQGSYACEMFTGIRDDFFAWKTESAYKDILER